MPITVAGRKIYLVRGKGRSNTVNICDANNRQGVYDWIIRFFEPTPFVTENEVSQFTSIDLLVAWLTEDRGGRIERKPEATENPQIDVFLPKTYIPEEDKWLQEALWQVEHALDQLVHEFIEFPYLHRREQSLHARLFSMLSTQPHFSRLFPLQDSNTHSQTVHREWPEAIIRPAKNKRGTFDLSIISPVQLAKTSVPNFLAGRLAAPIVIEMAVDEDVTHLANDIDKLLNSEIRYAYVVHFLRGSYPDPDVERLIMNPGGVIRIVHVRLLGGQIFYKLLDDKEISVKDASGSVGL